jgi:AraC family transcriptional regulator, alkane utilization regulator
MTETPNLLTGMPFPAEVVPGPSGTDVLSDVLRVFRVTGAALLRGDFRAPWSWVTPPASAIAAMLHPGATRLVIFHIVAEGHCWVEIAGGPRLRLQHGDVVGFPHGHAHTMGAGDGATCVPIASLFPPQPWTELPVLRQGDAGALTRIVCVYLHCDDLVFNPLLDSLPEMLVARPSQDGAAQWLSSNLRYMIAEANRGTAGSACLLARMTELLFIEMLRLHLIALREQDVGWLAALKDRHVSRVLHLFHSEPARAWTKAALARQAGLSRSALDERFRKLLATSPGRYLTKWRLQRAAQALRHTKAGVAQIAADVGYGSEEAFSRAFKRFTGSSPAAWRRRRPRTG